MRESLVDVLVDDVRLVQDQVALDQDRHLAVRVHHVDVFRLVVQVDVTDFEVHAFFEQYEAAAMGEGAGRTRVQHHHFECPLKTKKSGRPERPTLSKSAGRHAGPRVLTYFTFFQNAALRRQTMTVSTPRNSSTHAPTRTRWF